MKEQPRSEKQQRYDALCEEMDRMNQEALCSPEGQRKLAERVLLFNQLHGRIWQDMTIEDLLD